MLEHQKQRTAEALWDLEIGMETYRTIRRITIYVDQWDFVVGSSVEWQEYGQTVETLVHAPQLAPSATHRLEECLAERRLRK